MVWDLVPQAVSNIPINCIMSCISTSICKRFFAFVNSRKSWPFFCGGLQKKQFMQPPLVTTFERPNSRITAAVNSVTQDILHQVWNELHYYLYVLRVAGGRTYSIYTNCNMSITKCILRYSHTMCIVKNHSHVKSCSTFWMTMYFEISVCLNTSLNIYINIFPYNLYSIWILKDHYANLQ